MGRKVVSKKQGGLTKGMSGWEKQYIKQSLKFGHMNIQGVKSESTKTRR